MPPPPLPPAGAPAVAGLPPVPGPPLVVANPALPDEPPWPFGVPPLCCAPLPPTAPPSLSASPQPVSPKAPTQIIRWKATLVIFGERETAVLGQVRTVERMGAFDASGGDCGVKPRPTWKPPLRNHRPRVFLIKGVDSVPPFASKLSRMTVAGPVATASHSGRRLGTIRRSSLGDTRVLNDLPNRCCSRLQAPAPSGSRHLLKVNATRSNADSITETSSRTRLPRRHQLPRSQMCGIKADFFRPAKLAGSKLGDCRPRTGGA
jgi:hypothetical protein